MGEELWSKSATALAALIECGDVSSREVIDAHLERIASVNAHVNAVVEVLADSARKEADEADRLQKQGAPLGPLHGVPFSIKTNIDVKDGATTEGCVALKDLVAPSDAPIVEKMRGAGAVALARTNMPDLGLRINTESSLYGAAHNPWDLTRTVGGSSGGEAAAIATGMSPLGLGNDIGGSLRNPAYCCGIASIKPSFGRVAQGNESSLIDPGLNSQLMLVQGVLARSVADVRLGFESIMGAHRRDPHAIDAPLVGPGAKKRVALVPEPEGGSTDPGVAAGVRAAGRALEEAGYVVEEISPPMLTEAYLSWSELMWTSLAVVGPLLESVMGDGGRAFLDFTSVEYPPRTPESEYLLHTQRYKVAKAFQSFLADYPVMVGPTWTQPPFPLGFDIASKENAWQVVEMFRFVLPANLLGLPAACVPTGLSTGLPTGVQVISARFREDLCLDAAQSIEDILGTLTPIDPRV